MRDVRRIRDPGKKENMVEVGWKNSGAPRKEGKREKVMEELAG